MSSPHPSRFLAALLLLASAAGGCVDAAPALDQEVGAASAGAVRGGNESSSFGNATAAGVQYLVRAGEGTEDVEFEVAEGTLRLAVTLRQPQSVPNGLTFELHDPAGTVHYLEGTIVQDVGAGPYTIHAAAGYNSDAEATIEVESPPLGDWRIVLWSQGVAVAPYEIVVAAHHEAASS